MRRETAELNAAVVVGLPLVQQGKLFNVAAVLCGGIGILMSYSSTQDVLGQSMEALANETAERVSYELQSYENAVEALGMVSKLSDPAATTQEKQAILDQ